MITRRSLVRTAFAAAFPGALLASPGWELWEKFAPHFVSAQGRVIDHSAGDRTTSEGQAYGLFFSLVAGDRERFGKILAWTQDNLAGGDLAGRLPAWLYGGSPNGVVSILDANPASDADLWLAYTLLQAGRIWQNRRYTELACILPRSSRSVK